MCNVLQYKTTLLFIIVYVRSGYHVGDLCCTSLVWEKEPYCVGVGCSGYSIGVLTATAGDHVQHV